MTKDNFIKNRASGTNVEVKLKLIEDKSSCLYHFMDWNSLERQALAFRPTSDDVTGGNGTWSLGRREHTTLLNGLNTFADFSYNRLPGPQFLPMDYNLPACIIRIARSPPRTVAALKRIRSNHKF